MATTKTSPQAPLPRPTMPPARAAVQPLKAPKPDYIDEIRKFTTHAELLKLWKQVVAGAPPAPWGAGKGLEHLVLRGFEIENVDVRWPFNIKMPGKGIVEQIDGALHLGHLSVLVEAKDHTAPIAVEPIYKLRAQLLTRPAGVIGAVFSRAGFTEPAILHAPWTAPQTVLLWSPEDLTEALTKGKMVEGMKAKYRWAVEHAIPDRDLRAELWP